ESLAAEDDDEAMSPHRLDENFHAGNRDRRQLLRHRDTAFGGRPAGPAISDFAGCVDCAEVAAHRDILGSDMKINAERFENSAADLILERIVAEQAEVPWAAARRDSRQNRRRQTADSLTDTGVQVRRSGRLELGLSPHFQGETAEAVGDDENDLGG